MAFNKVLERKIVFVVVMVALQCLAANAQATLVFHYDPDTGNVAMDTRGTSSGTIINYWLELNAENTDVRFRPENHIALTQSTFDYSRPLATGETTLGQQGSGLFTIGDILPTGLSPSTWGSLFDGINGVNGFNAALGVPIGRADFVYGRPVGDFDNRFDYLDPDTLTWAQSAKLIYRQWSGEVVLDTAGPDGGYISAFGLQSEDSRFLSDDYTPPIDSAAHFVHPDTIDFLYPALEPGAYSLGEILQSGLSNVEFKAAVTSALFSGRAGYGLTELDLETEGLAFSLVFEAVPEPTASLLAVMASGMLLVRRRARTPRK